MERWNDETQERADSPSPKACLTDGTAPLLITAERSTCSWLIASRVAQAKLSPGIPDPIEVMFGVPRCIVPAFARVVALVSRRSQSAVDGAGLQEEELDFEASVLRLELESAWPARLQGRRDSRRVQYGAVSLCRGPAPQKSRYLIFAATTTVEPLDTSAAEGAAVPGFVTRRRQSGGRVLRVVPRSRV